MNYISYRWSLYKLHRIKNKAEKIFKRKIEEARKTCGLKKVYEVMSTESYDVDLVKDEIADLMTKYLRATSEKMSLPFPPFSTDSQLWEESHITGRRHLTNNGITYVRNLIRKEKRERLQIISQWIAIIIGLIGALTGLLAIILK
jgi:hypothetical protein